MPNSSAVNNSQLFDSKDYDDLSLGSLDHKSKSNFNMT